jgi:S1-C subfamily serine protease
MEEQTTPAEQSAPAEQPAPTEQLAPAPAQAGRTHRFFALIGALAATVVILAALGGVLVGHEAWPSSSGSTNGGGTSAPATSPFTGFGGNGGFGGYGNPYAGGGGQSGTGSSGYGTTGGAATGASANTDSIATKVDPAIVDINSSLGYQGAGGAGTGIVVSSNGLVLTNNHVIDGGTKITARDIGNGKTYKVTVVGYDPSKDVAVLQLQGASGLKTASLGDSSKVKVGDAVVGIGNAGGTGGTPTAAGGSITALSASLTAQDDFGGSEQLSGMLATNAEIQPGDSGGPLVNSDGQVIGIDTAGSTGSSFASYPSGTDGYAIPIDTVLAIAKQIEAGQGTSTVHVGGTAFLGLLVAAPGEGGFGFGGSGLGGSTTSSGVTVNSVISGKPAATAGLAQGDVITSLDGKTIDSESDISSTLLALHPGDKIALGWTDTSGQTHTATVSLASGPAA